MPSGEERIRGVERDILEAFLALIQDKFPDAEEAAYFLETNVGASAINISIANLRDVVSHLGTVIRHPEWSREEKLAQLANAEEHTRRAIMDSYNKAVVITSEKVFELLDTYKRMVLPLKSNKNPTIQSAPELLSLTSQLRAIGELRTRARKAKGRNVWDNEWEGGVEALIAAFWELKEIQQTMEEYVSRATQIRDTRKATVLTWWGIIATIIAGILGIIVSILASRP